MTVRGWSLPLPPSALRQPDGYTCGPTALLVARMLQEPAYAASVGAADVADEVHRLHRGLTATRGTDGGWQLPWPRRLGTPPWAVARALSGRRRHRVRLLRGRARATAPVLAAARTGPVPVYVGSRWLPRHVLVVVGVVDEAGADAAVLVHDPARGTAARWRVVDALGGRPPQGRWPQLWFAVVPS